MKETEKRIEAYKKALPEIREKVLAVALLLVMSIAMMTSATFAWLTISRAPEVTEVSTTVAANGNLEIALATSGTAPGESQVGDSSANEKQSVTAANITWGNLVNLSDPSYGLENLTLRPAQLNKSALLTSPLWGAEYSIDGRIIKLNSDFKYSIWNGNYFVVDEDSYGVRAISSAEYLKDDSGANAEAEKIEELKNQVKGNNQKAATKYSDLGANKEYMQSLANMMGLYMTARMNSDDASLSNPTVKVADIQNLRDMYKDFIDCFVLEADAIAELINFSLAMQNYNDYKAGTYNPEKVYEAIDILGTIIEVAEDETITETTATKVTTSGLKNLGVQIGSQNYTGSSAKNTLEQFQKDYNTIVSDYKKLVDLCKSGTSFTWKDTGINDIVNHLVNVGACTIGKDNTPISSIGASNAMSYLSGTQEARITNGILYRFEERVGGYIEVKELGISATVKRMGITVPATVKANIQTSASRDKYIFSEDFAVVEGIVGELDLGDLVYMAQDTYGLAVDIWVRTNAENSYLTLEGNVIANPGEPIEVKGKDANGNEVDIYVLQISGTDEEGNAVSYTVDAYEGKANRVNEETGQMEEVDAWINAETHTAVNEVEYVKDHSIPKKMETPIIIEGFEGENRVWNDDGSMLSTDATTQGSGSCYVYYADTPEDQARSLKLLEAFGVAFVDAEGKLMATAVMDTERFFAESGRVTVPLVLSPSDSLNLGEDHEGNIVYAITTLEKNIPTRITAIVYLDGTKLTNEQVLAASDIQGKLNIQFGSNFEMKPIDNEELQGKELRVSASVDKTSFDYDTATGPMTSTVTVTVDGTEPGTVTAFFMRQISSAQGSREETMTFEKNSEGKWVGDYTFTAPGNYVLRTVRLDGVDHDLSGNLPTVTVTGFAIQSLSCTQATNNHVNVMTAASSSSVDLTLKFATDDPSKMPRSVQGRYIKADDNSAVNVDFTYDSTTSQWKGTATFLSSGDYSMEYVVLDGEYYYLASGLWQTASVTLGMRVAVYTTSPHSFKYVPSEMKENEKLLGMQVMIMDNEENGLPGLSGVKLSYGMKGSGIKKMDADLTWNGSYYVGELTTTGPGIWQFSNVVVGSNTLTDATTSPIFTIKSPEPPEYYNHNTYKYQYKPNNDAVMNVRITNSAAASVQAYIIKNGAAEGTWVTGTIGEELTTTDGKTANNWSFKVPVDANGYQDGNWQLTALRLWDVFAADGTPYTEDAPLVIDVSDTNNATKVVARINVTFAQGQSKDFGKDASGTVTGKFMDSYTVSGLNVDIKDFEGNAVQGVSDVKLTFTYGNNSGTYGGYTSTSLTNAVADFTIALANDGSGIHFAQNGNQTIQYAGSWTTTFSFKVNGVETKYSGENLPNNTPQFTVSSVTPTVKITATSPNGSVNAYVSHTVKNYYVYRDVTIKTTSYSAGKNTEGTIANVCFVASKSTTVTYSFCNLTPPTVTITLNGIGNASNATLSFGNSAKIYASREGTTITQYTWEDNGTCIRYVGLFDSVSAGDDTRTVAGTITANTLVLTYNGNTYNVTVPTITINNPY